MGEDRETRGCGVTEAEELEIVWAFGTGHQRGWKRSNNPCVRAPSKTKVWKSWQKTKIEGKRWYKAQKLEYTVEAFLVKVELTMQAQARMRKDEREANDFVPDPVQLTRYFNEYRWDVDDMGSHSEIKEKKQNPIKYVKPVKRLTKEEIDNKYQNGVKQQVADMKRMLK